MELRIMKAKYGFVWAYKDEEGHETFMSDTLYLGINDTGERYYEVSEQYALEEMSRQTQDSVNDLPNSD